MRLSRQVVTIFLVMLACQAVRSACAQTFDSSEPVFLNAAQRAAGALAPEELPREELPPPKQTRPSPGKFPALPPDPYEHDKEPLPPLEEELWQHGGSQLYEPEGERLNWPEDCDSHYEVLRLPEDWQEPQPLTLFSDFLGVGPIHVGPGKWPGEGGYVWEPRFVGYGSYELLAFALEENNQRQDVLGHQLLLDLDLRLTGTERFHVQFRPVGRRNTGGSFYQFSNPDGYEDNSTATPDRYWFEGELASVLGAYLDPFAARDINFVGGRFPFALHNSLLLNSDLLGVAISKNNIYLGNLSNLNVQAFYGKNDVNAFTGADAHLYGLHASIDRRQAFYEATYSFMQHESDDTRDAHFLALSRTKTYGSLSLAGRALMKYGDRGGTGNGRLLVVESNYDRIFTPNCVGIEHGTFFCNTFYASQGWSNLGGGNFNRLRTSFEVNPLVRISAGRPSGDTWGSALGVQLFRHHEDESWIPEFAFEAIDGEPVWGFGLRYMRKTSSRTYFEALGVYNFSDDSQFDREGVFISHTLLF